MATKVTPGEDRPKTRQICLNCGWLRLFKGRSTTPEVLLSYRSLPDLRPDFFVGAAQDTLKAFRPKA